MNYKIYLLPVVLLFCVKVTHSYNLAGIPDYQGLISNQKNLLIEVTALCKRFKSTGASIAPVNQSNFNVSSPLFAGQPIATVQIPYPAATVFQGGTYSSIFPDFASLIGAPNYPQRLSYVSLFTPAFQVYKEVVPALPPSAPFEKGSAPLALYTSLAYAVTTYLQARLATLTIENYGQVNGAAELKKEITALDGVMDSVVQVFQNKLPKNSADLAQHFQTIRQQYAQKKAQLLLGWFDPLLTQLCTRYALSLAQSGQVKTDLNMTNVDGYVSLVIASLSAFSQNQSTTLLGTYGSSLQALTALSSKVAQLYNYQAIVYQNAIEHTIQVLGQPGTVLSQEFFTIITRQLQTAQSYYNAAATYYGTAQQTTTGQAYAQIASALQMGSQYWQNAVTSIQKGYAGQAAQAFQQASTQVKTAGFTALSAYFYQQFQQALFAYNQSIFDTYGNYYQTLVGNYTDQAQKVPAEQTAQSIRDAHASFQQLFYPLTDQEAQNAAYKGMGWLAALALPSFKEMLSTLQTLQQATTTSTTSPSDQQQYLQQGIALLQKISQGSQYIFYTSPDVFNDSKNAADANNSLYTVAGLVESLEQYATIIKLFEQADAVFAQPDAYAALPFAQILPQGSITSWKQFIMLHEAYWLLLCAQQAMQYVGCSAVGVHTDELVSFSLGALLNAQSLYQRLGLTAMVTYIKQQQQSITGSAASPAVYNGKTVQQLLQQKAQKYASLPLASMTTLIDVQSALACYQTGGLLGYEPLQKNFFDLLDAYTLFVNQNVQDPFSGFTLSALALQGLYAQNGGWQTTTSYADNFSNALAAFTQNLITFATGIETLVAQKLYTQALTQQKKFLQFYQKVQAFEQEQERLASLYNVTTGPYLSVVPDGPVVIAFKASTLKDPLKRFDEPSYALALLSSDAAQSLYQQVKTSLLNNTFTGSLRQQIMDIENLYDQAVSYFSAAGRQQEVATTELLKSKAIALLYFSMVIPTDAVKTISLSQLFSSSSTSVTSKNQPFYLLRSLALDITALAQSFITNASVTQAAAQSSSLQIAGASSTDLSPEIAKAQQLLTTAQTFIGKTVSSAQDIQTLLTMVLLPLYRIQLQQEGYNGLLSLDDQVQRYSQQLSAMMTKGITIAQQIYKTSYSLVTQQQSDGSEHVVLQGRNVPLDAVPQYPNQVQSALLYYTLCNRFFDTTQPTVTIGNATYMTFSDQQFQQQIAQAFSQANLVGIVSYKSQIDGYLATLKASANLSLAQATLAQKANLNFADYQAAYASVNTMFINLLALIQGATQSQTDTVQQNVQQNNQVKAAGFNAFAQVGTYFLMGDPSSASFGSVLKDVANNYYSAAQQNQNDRSPYLTMAKLYEQVGDYTLSLPLSMPQIDDYPSAQPVGSPSAATLATGKKSFNTLSNLKVTCPSLIQPSNALYASAAPLVWNNYQKASGFYQQAYTMYQQGYDLTLNTVLTNADMVRTYGKFFYYDIFSALQEFSLFARNAYQVGRDGYTMSVNPTFASLVQQGSTQGQAGALQGFNQLTTGSSVSVNQYAQQQYAAMRNLVLNALIYITGLQGSLNTLLKNIGVAQAYTGSSVAANNPLTLGYGQLLLCGLTAYVPGLQAKLSVMQNGTSEDSFGPLFDVPPYLLDLQTSFDGNSVKCIVYSDTFLTAMQYLVENSIGSPSSGFGLLGNSANNYSNLLIFNNLVSELWLVMRDAYGQAFLPELYAAIKGSKNQEDAITAYENSIDSAIENQEQSLVINPAGYIG